MAEKYETTELTLTKSELAFLNATIELMREEQAGRQESITIIIDDEPQFAAAVARAAIKVGRKVNRWVEKNGGWVAVATAVADWAWGFSASTDPVSVEHAKALRLMKEKLQKGPSLEELIQLRDMFEGKVKGVRSASSPDPKSNS